MVFASRVQILPLPLIHWSILGELLNLSGLLFSYLIREDDNAGLDELL